MDGLSAVLEGPRAHGAFLVRCLMGSPWAIRIADEVPLSLTAVVRGEPWAVPDAQPPIPLRPGDVVVALGQPHWTIADGPTTAVTATIRPGQECYAPDGSRLTEAFDLGVRSWGNDASGDTVMLSGSYLLEGEVSRRLLRALPPLFVVNEAELGSPLIGLLDAEIVRADPGQDAVLDRLLDLLLIAVLRAWFSRPDAQAPGWYLALGDEVAGPALRLMQERPADPWSVEVLASACNVSRAAFARRFATLVGEPPLTFLTRWRLALAADLLADPGRTLESVARQVGYSTPFALSSAFKREYGVSPREFRTRVG
ncbi:AraC-type DNA-binding protein [Nocardioides terrae]|uniref:AraC-type DNA-binding protein n=1 Tax=Nocardioides terrae TaxID=574651 RepID=A0A1I1LCV1_9ACTN|nr:AraC family transcriptional regulator [Nocardioides terrae]SFC67360.1 AraC-type DNA-binding protein [Nocardioides terrae]